MNERVKDLKRRAIMKSAMGEGYVEDVRLDVDRGQPLDSVL